MAVWKLAMLLYVSCLITLLPRGSAGLLLAQDDVISAEEFHRLAKDDQRSYLKMILSQRLLEVENIFVSSETRAYNCSLVNGSRGSVIDDGGRHEFELWRRGDSYRMDIRWYASSKNNEPTTVSSSGYDADAGVARCTGTHESLNGEFGRIDVEHDRIVWNNRYSCWIGGTFAEHERFLVPYLLTHGDEIEIAAPADDGQVEISVGYHAWGQPERVGSRRVWLDPEKGFMPARIEDEWQVTSDAKKIRVSAKCVVSEARRVGSIWMPTAFQEESVTSLLGPNVVSVFDTVVDDFEIGAVEPADLDVKFTAGMEIVDATRGITYIADAAGQPSGEVRSLMAARNGPASPGVSGLSRSNRAAKGALVLVNVGLLLAAAGWFFIRRWKRDGRQSR